ncbi:MAG TPA: nickel-responsive transcriptional regulator NikR [Sumerlaeia bacterium]|nr:nickel-responsive transcriptional regulator NikR [Sumerlaeia bacterium]
MSDLIRLSISIERPLYERMQRLIDESGYANRSEFVRDLVRGRLVDEEWRRNEEALGTITLIYDHHKRQLSERLTDLQHRHHREILVSSHVHLDHDLCAEMILVRGRAKKVEELANQLGKEKGVLHTALSIGSTGKRLA